ncbi:hypothetical protein F7725_018066 [Dissostichus mawsoni]|uniref:Uncharacterized protein n=1 Tax=Dissostichus mawsoni TaxID=36200 RepID=A0A7J5XS36_DISMA|nr:hypothetical protein F7725_018066 [Dissostichus mawsoni]
MAAPYVEDLRVKLDPYALDLQARLNLPLRGLRPIQIVNLALTLKGKYLHQQKHNNLTRDTK